MHNRRLQRPVRVYTCQNVKLLEISCTGSYNMLQHLSEMQRNIVDHVEDASCCTVIMSKITRCICEQWYSIMASRK